MEADMSGKCILMIEDDEEMIALGELILAKEGFEVLSATSGAVGLDLLRDNDVDLILLDIMMDEMDGWQVLETVKADKQYSAVPVIMLTARHYLEDEEMTARHADQFVSYVVKPFVVRELVQEVRKVLSAGN
jgi:DNA-binding response OmpR family regulator